MNYKHMKYDVNSHNRIEGQLKVILVTATFHV